MNPHTINPRLAVFRAQSKTLAAALAVGCLLGFNSQSLAQETVIFSDSFAGSSSESLGGKTPTIGSGTWDGASDDAIKADGSFSGQGQKWLNWTPSSGYVYELKVTINQTSGTWAGLLFKPTAGNPIWSGFGPDGVGTMLDVEGTWPNVGGIGANGSGTYMIRLDTTGDNGSGGGWKTSYFFNGTQKGTTYTWSTNPAINGVGIVTYNDSGTSTGSFDNFELKRTPVIYSDTFTGSSSNSLSGQTTTTGGGIWDGASDDAIKADGSFAGQGQKWLNWTPSSGYVYELKVTINQTSGNWAGLLFKPTAGNPIWSGFGGSGVGTMLDVEGTWPSAGGIGDNGTGTYMIRLDTTAANWTTSYFFNGVQKGATYIWGTNPSIDGVGIVTYNNSGTSIGSFSNFELKVQETSPVIYSDAFTGSASNSLSGRPPTIGGGVWDGASDDAIKADGSFAGTGQKWLNWTPSNGYVYELEVTINQTSGNWAGLLFKPTAGAPIWSGFGPSGVGTMLNVDETHPNVGGIGTNGSGTYMIRLDTTGDNGSGGGWTTRYYFNGVQKGATHTWSTNPAIDGVGIISYNNSVTSVGSFSNFELRYGASGPGLPTYASWATDNAGGQTADLDYDIDGVSNGVEFFMNADLGFTANPGLVGNTVTWPNGGNIDSAAYGSEFVVQTSTDLVNWTDVPGTGDANLANASASVAYTVTGSGKQFVRLKVTPSSPN
jgi:hypothetical protein